MEPVIKSNGLGTPSPCLNYRIRVEGLNQIPNPNKKIDDFEGERRRCLLWVVGLANRFHPSTLICGEEVVVLAGQFIKAAILCA